MDKIDKEIHISSEIDGFIEKIEDIRFCLFQGKTKYLMRACYELGQLKSDMSHLDCFIHDTEVE